VIAVLDPWVEFVMGRTGPQKTGTPSCFPALPYSTVWGELTFSDFLPLLQLRPRPTHTPDGFWFTIGGNKQGPFQGVSVGRARMGVGRGSPKHTYPALFKGGVCRVKTHRAPPPNEYYPWEKY